MSLIRWESLFPALIVVGLIGSLIAVTILAKAAPPPGRRIPSDPEIEPQATFGHLLPTPWGTRLEELRLAENGLDGTVGPTLNNRSRIMSNHTSPPSDSVFYWDWMKHGDNLFVNRSMFFVLAETALFVAAATKIVGPYLQLLAWIGVVVTLAWTYVGAVYAFGTNRYISIRLREVEKRWQQYLVERRRWLFVANNFIGLVVPLCTLAAWIVLLVAF